MSRKESDRIIDGRIQNIQTPTPERVAKGDIVIEEGERGGITIRAVRTFNDPLTWYAANGHITHRQKRAGINFYFLWYRGAARSRVVSCRYDDIRLPATDYEGFDQAQLAFQDARRAIFGVKEKRIAFHVCCMGEAAGRHGQMDLLRSALDDLVRHFAEVDRARDSH